MSVMAAFVALFPYSVVRLFPMLANILAALAQHLLHFVVGRFLSKKMANRFNHFAINIELQLFACRIADSHGL